VPHHRAKAGDCGDCRSDDNRVEVQRQIKRICEKEVSAVSSHYFRPGGGYQELDSNPDHQEYDCNPDDVVPLDF